MMTTAIVKMVPMSQVEREREREREREKTIPSTHSYPLEASLSLFCLFVAGVQRGVQFVNRTFTAN
jgi:hypothetical protein